MKEIEKMAKGKVAVDVMVVVKRCASRSGMELGPRLQPDLLSQVVSIASRHWHMEGIDDEIFHSRYALYKLRL